MILSRLLLFLLALILLSGSAQALVVREIEKMFPLEAGVKPQLRLVTFYGSVQLKPGKDSEIRVSVRQDYEAEDEAQADRIQKSLTLKMEQKQGLLDISAEYSRDISWTFENWPPVKLAFVITAPPGCVADLFSRDGGVTVSPMAGDFTLRTYYGVINHRGAKGNVTARSEYGDIIVAHCTGNLTLRSISGAFRVGPVGGFADVFGFGGEIEVQSAGGGIKAETSGADLSVGFRHPVVAPATIKTGGANILVTLDARSSCTLDLRASFFGKVVNVKDALPLKAERGALGKSKVLASMNGGGPLLDVRASGGYIYLFQMPLPVPTVPTSP